MCLQVAEANKENERDVKKKWRWLDMKSPERTREANLCASLHERVIAAGRQLGNMPPGSGPPLAQLFINPGPGARGSKSAFEEGWCWSCGALRCSLAPAPGACTTLLISMQWTES